jgi:hemerythrin-like domain-containing protein
MKQAVIALIRDEHRALAAVLDALLRVVKRVEQGGKAPDFPLMHAMLYYLREFPERRHHPSEDASLFALLLQRTSAADELVHELEAEHDKGEAMLGMLTVALSTWEAGRADGVERFSEALRQFSEFYWQHMDKEENGVLPIAESALTGEDWKAVHAEFSSHHDPLLGKTAGDEFDTLFSEIVLVTPAPIGLGEPK